MQNYTKKHLLEIYNLPFESLCKMAAKEMSKRFEFCSLISAKTGKCSQNCKYCAQSSYYSTDIKTHPLVEIEDVIKTAKEAKSNGASRFAIVTSGKGPDVDKDFEKICEMIQKINELGLKSCASLGILNEKQALLLKSCGLKRFHHNINTCRSYYKEVCTTHSYQDRIQTINLVKNIGIELCCGVILGMGETVEQRIEMALELAQINPESVPVNFLCPIKNTPFESYYDKIDEENILRSLMMFKIALPNAVIRFAGGRNLRLSEKNQEIALEYAVEGLILGNMLTVTGTSPEKDIKTVEKMGKILCTTI